MEDRLADQRHARRPGVAGGMALLVTTGVILGAAYNFLALHSQPRRGLSWITRQETLPSLEQVTGATGGEGTSAPVVASIPPDMDDPMGLGAAPQAEGSLPVIPDLGRPIQVQLPVVKKFYDARAALFLDARDPEDYVRGHIAGAINVPYDRAATDPDLTSSIHSEGRPIITYCDGGGCEVSISLAETLVHQAGFSKVLVFLSGYGVWKDAGYPVARGASPYGG